MAFIHDDFLLTSKTARHIYHEYAKHQPIFDYHCHLSPQLIAEDYHFDNITEIWLHGDHYKWRAMRANGVSEEKITGVASDEEKFSEWAKTVKSTVGNPLFHWTALELKRYFDIEDILSEDNWNEIYETANEKIKAEAISTQSLIKQSNVALIGTTDNPEDDLRYHEAIAADNGFNTKVVPSFRPDAATHIHQSRFIDLIKSLEAIVGKSISTYAHFLEVLKQRIDYFDERGTVASDHALETIVYEIVSDDEIESIFEKRLNEEVLTEREVRAYMTRVLLDLASYYHEKGWVMQLHFGALRNNNQYWYDKLGPDTGFDSIRDVGNDAVALNQFLNHLYSAQTLPKMILYPLNPTQFDVIACAATNFQSNEEGIKSKIQLGSGWWFNDTERGMLAQMKALADQGLLMNFVGMLTDSRSFLSYPRHEYFRRVLCQFIGEEVDNGKIPNDEGLLKELIENICYKNAERYFTKGV
ncbi:glucuronate isomerase [Aerococcaceae bacterium zg-ZUI334]|uniref:glucuronate isomerase n=1 Tax=Aerococcaceae TaxID=186827 RepID=UPI0013B68C42|nr:MULTISPECIES: glucuronate isomerase [unclassified Facklamia]MBR7927633.1 glucuronate isomerase [Aerococcaceae bacterium zg-ZUI334]MBS4462185.1 glucuronate isomerase [Aerococcaceae bacterium zg-B36]QQD65456.1 glucuronate isomerase [Aerococcaceae bacterium zg-252]NEW64644.1 glucuronate isomerase [Facklamia sp. 252]NEW67969.1 glucuronate isomerase [Facklamia sp. 253]